MDTRRLSPEVHAQWRWRISLSLLGTDLVACVLVLFHTSGPVRLLAGVVQGLLVPGWSVVGRLKISNVAMEIGLVLATSVSLLMIVAQILMSVNWWHLWATQIIWGLVFAGVLALHLPTHRPRRRVKDVSGR